MQHADPETQSQIDHSQAGSESNLVEDYPNRGHPTGQPFEDPPRSVVQQGKRPVVENEVAPALRHWSRRRHLTTGQQMSHFIHTH